MLLSLQAAGGIPFFIFLFGSILSVALARIFGTVWLQELIRFVEAAVNLFQKGQSCMNMPLLLNINSVDVLRLLLPGIIDLTKGRKNAIRQT